MSAKVRTTVAAVIVLLPLPIFVVLRHIDTHRPPPSKPFLFHFVIVTVATLIATALAIGVGVAATRVRNIQVTFLAAAFASLSVLFGLHGLATPTIILGPKPNQILPVAAELSVMCTAFWLWLSVLPSDAWMPARLARRQSFVVPAWVTITAGFDALLLWRPAIAADIRVVSSRGLGIAVAITLVLTVVTCARYWRSYRYSRFPLQQAIVFAAGWLGVTQVIMAQSKAWWLSWWSYHVLMVGLTTAFVVGLVRQYALGSSIALAVRGLFTTDPVQRLEAGISPATKGLVLAVEAKDVYTGGHSFRVALSALRVGEAMGIGPEGLRALASGGIVHDVGKVQVPDQILNKPGKLTPEERAQIELHPVTGFDMCRRLGFLGDELDVIRHHHERWDGTGYPDRLVGEDIPLLARILAVADVYDALTSARSYREPWTHARAREAILEWSGTHFDPRVVEAWSGITQDAPLIDPDAALPESTTTTRVRRRVDVGLPREFVAKPGREGDSKPSRG